MKKIWFSGLLLCFGSAAAQGGAFSPLTEVCPQALDIRNYGDVEQQHLIRGQGTEGWLFGEQDFRSYDPVLDYVPQLARLKDTLAKKGTTLLVLYVPPRPVSASAHLDLGKSVFKNVNLAELRASYFSAVQAVNAVGIYSPNVLELQQKRTPGAEFFFPRDHHLNLAAMTAIAADLTEHIMQKRLLSEEDKVPFALQRSTKLMVGSYNYVSNQICRRFVLPTRYAVAISKRQDDADLLADAAPPVVLAGDSNVFRDGGEESLAALLRHGLQADVLNVGIQGGGPDSSLENYILSGDFQDNPPKVLIWEMDAGYDLRPFLKQIVPAVQGQCATSKQQFALRPSEKVTISPTGPNHYFVFQVKDLSVRELQVELGLASGERTKIELSHTSRSAAHPLFYFEPGESVMDMTLMTSAGIDSVNVAECAPSSS